MEILQRRINQAMKLAHMEQVDLVKKSGESVSKVSMLVNGKTKDPRMSTLINIAEALDVSLDYLAGRTDNPMGFCDEELEGLRIDARARELLEGFELLPIEGKETVQEMVNFQLSKKETSVSSTRMEAATVEVA